MGKKIKGLVLLAVLMLLALIPANTYASSTHHFSFDIYNCNALDEEEWLVCVDDSGEPIELTPLSENAFVYPGKLIRLDVHYTPDVEHKDNMLQLGFFYNSNALEPLKVENTIYTLPLLTTYYGGIYPAKGTAPASLKKQTNFEVYTNDVAGKSKIKAEVEDGTNKGYLETEGTLFTMFFTVKQTATAGDLIPFTYNAEDIVMSNGSNTSFENAQVQVFKELDTDSTLSGITISDGTTTYELSPGFTSDHTDYNVVLPSDVGSITISADPTKTTSSVAGTGEVTLEPGEEKEVELLVTSESGHTDIYTVTVYRTNNDATLSSLSLSGINIGEFKPGTTLYNATVPYTTTSTTVSATATDATNASVSGTGNKDLDVGLNEIEIVVTAEDGSTTNTYKVNVTREAPSTDATLATLTVDGQAIQLVDNQYVYNLTSVANNKESINIGATASDSNATITGTGNQNLTVGDNSFDVVVTAQDENTSLTYTINIRRKSNDSTLKSLTVTSDPAGTMDNEFTSNVTEYTYTAKKGETEVVISAETNDEHATVSGTGTYNPQTTKKVELTVTSENGTTTVYTVNLDIEKSTNANLSSITVDGQPLEGFNSGTPTYDITVANDKDSITIGGTKADGDATVVGLGDYDLDFGENPIVITVTAEDGTTTNTYTINVTRALSNDASITSLTVDGQPIQLVNNQYVYTLDNVAYSKESINIGATATNSYATITGTGSKNLAVGDNSFDVVITSQDESDTKTYTINIRRKNNDSTLKSLTVTSDPAGTMNKTFNSGITEYTYTTEKGETEVVISAEANDSNATVTGTGTYNPQTTNKVDIVVTSENGNKTTYTVNLAMGQSHDATMSSITIDGEPIEGFNSGTPTYDITVGNDKDSITVGGTQSDNDSIVIGLGDYDLDFGENEIIITVTAEDGSTTSTYTLNVTRALSNDASITSLTVDGQPIQLIENQYVYTLDTVAYSKESINIGATATNSYATITGTGSKNLAVGDNSFDVVITSQDESSTETYTINIRRKNNDSTLKSLTVTSDPEGTMNKTFNSGITEYTYTTEKGETEVIISAEANDSNATVTGTGTYNPQTTNKVDIVVTSENGNKTTYTVNLAIGQSHDATMSSITIDGEEISGFDSSIPTYDISLPNETSHITIGGTKSDDDSIVVGLGGYDLDYGENEIIITVTAEDGSTTSTYTLNVTRELSDNSNLASLIVDQAYVNGFEVDNYDYTLDSVSNDKTTIVIAATAEEEHATITGTGTKNLAVGDNSFDVVVTAQDGVTTSTYTINIRRKSNDSTLKSLDITADPAGTMDKPFTSDVIEYTYTAKKDGTYIQIDAEANEEHATVSGTGSYDATAYGEVEVVVTSENGDITVYTINLAVEQSNDATLSSITIDGEPIEGFNSDTPVYNITVSGDTESIVIDGTKSDEDSDVDGFGSHDLNYGANQIVITVTSEDGTETKTYTINVTRTLGSDAILIDLNVDNNCVPDFASDKFNYILDGVSNDTESIVIGATASDSNATITGTGTKNLVVGDNRFEVVVTSQDESTSATYAINIRRKSDDSTLKSLTVTSDPAGTMDKPFTSDVTEYTYTAKKAGTYVQIDAEVNEEHATVSGTGSYDATVYDEVEVVVISENGTQTIYTVNLAVEQSNDATLSSITIDGEPIEGFDSATPTYDILLSDDVESITIGGTQSDGSSSVDGFGVYDLNYGNNPIVITVTAEDGTTNTYTLNVSRGESRAATLSSLTVDYVEVPDFAINKYVYNLDGVSNDTESILIGATASDSNATITGTGTKNLVVGDNSFDVVVTSQDGTESNTYTINIRRKNDDSTLKSLTVTADPAGTMDKSFESNVTEYTYTAKKGVTEVVISAEANEEHATVSGTGTYNPSETDSVEVVVTSENGTTTIYTVTLEVEQSSDATLSGITINGEPLEGFDSDTPTYNITVDGDVDSITVDGTQSDGDSTVDGLGTYDIDYGTTPIVITVTSEDGTETKTYTINVTKALGTEALLTTLTVNGTEVPGFEPDVYVYNLDAVSNDTESIEIGATASDSHATITGTGSKDLVEGDNSFDVVVTSQDEAETNTYVINIRRKKNDSTLKSLTVISDPAGTMDSEFASDVTEYTYTAKKGETEVVISAEANDSNATVSGTGTYNPQTTNKVDLTVTSENGTTTIYTINLEIEISENANLSSITIDGEPITGFDSDTTIYEIDVANDKESIVIGATGEDGDSSIEGLGEKSLIGGSNSFDITVTAEDGVTTKTYTVIVNKAIGDDVTLSDLTVDDETVDGFSPDITSYDLGTVENDVTSINIGATPTDSNATVSGTGVKGLSVGDNTFEVVVTSADGQNSGSYVITVNRKANSNANLSELVVEGYELTPTFDADEINYTLSVPSDVESVTVDATSEYDNATIDGTGDIALEPGENTVEVVVTAEDGVTTKTYTIVITRGEDDEKITSIQYGHTIEDGMIKSVVYKSLPATLKDQLDNDNDKLFIYADEESTDVVAEDQYLGTGMIIKLIKNDIVKDSDLLVVKGELTGDGEIRINDVVKAVNAYVEITELDGVWLEAADVTGDGEIRINDIVAVVNLYVED